PAGLQWQASMYWGSGLTRSVVALARSIRQRPRQLHWRFDSRAEETCPRSDLQSAATSRRHAIRYNTPSDSIRSPETPFDASLACKEFLRPCPGAPARSFYRFPPRQLPPPVQDTRFVLYS